MGAFTDSPAAENLARPAWPPQPLLEHTSFSQIPLLIVEDDVLFAPDFNARLSQVIQRVNAEQPGDKPAYFVSLYR